MKFEWMFFCIIFGDLDVFSITWVETAIFVLLRWRLGCSQCARVTQGTGEPTSNISLSFHRCQKHISAISTMSKAYWVQWRVRVSCFKTLCPGMEGLVWHSATTQSACGEISSLKLHPPRFLVAGTVFSTLMVTIVFVQLAIKYSHITSPKSTTKSQTMLARGATII